jgi:FSR family fosmidomycin resistance protein-like MFS transporter
LFMSAVGAAHNYAALVALLMVGGLGAASFHPQAAVLAGRLSERRAVALSFFVSGGTLGFSLGPLFAVTTVALFGLGRTWIAAAPGLVVAALLITWFRRVPPAAHSHAARPSFAELKPFARPLALLYFAVVFRSAVSIGFMTFLSVFLHQRGFSVAAGGVMLTIYLAAGAIGGFAGGVLADRWGGRRVVIASFAFALPLYVGFLLLPIIPGLVCLVLGSVSAQSALPVNVVMGQELSPRHASTISSLLMGAAWGLGALIVGPVGAFADAHGLRAALLGLTTLLACGIVVAWLLPRIAVDAVPALAIEHG